MGQDEAEEGGGIGRVLGGDGEGRPLGADGEVAAGEAGGAGLGADEVGGQLTKRIFKHSKGISELKITKSPSL